MCGSCHAILDGRGRGHRGSRSLDIEKQGYRKRTIYLLEDLDKEFAHTAIDLETTYSRMAEDALRSHLHSISSKRGKLKKADKDKQKAGKSTTIPTVIL